MSSLETMTSTEEYEFDEDTGKLVQSILNQFGFNEEVIKAAKQLGIYTLFF